MLAREDLAAAPHRPGHAHAVGGAAVPDQGREAVPLQQQPAADLPLPRHDRPEDRLHRSRRPLPGRHGRARRRAPGRRRSSTPPNPAARPGRCSTGASRTSTTSRRCTKRNSRRAPERPGPPGGRGGQTPAAGPADRQALSGRACDESESGGVPLSKTRLTGQSAKGGPVDLDDTPEQAAYRAQVRSWLEEHASEAPAVQTRAAEGEREEAGYIAARRTWQGKLAEGGLAGVTWPKEYGGQGLGPIEQVDLQPGDRPRQGPRDPRRDRDRDARPDDHRPRQRGAEVALPRPDAPRRRGLVPAVLRARRRLGPGGRAGTRAPAGRRQLAAVAGRRCGRPTPSSPPTGCCSPAPTPTCPSTRA